MTRINLIPPSELCDQHLLAEHREITRIPNHVMKHYPQLNLEGRPADYTLGTGHVRFFYDRLGFLLMRYILVHQECVARGFAVKYIWPSPLWTVPPSLDGGYAPTPRAMAISRERIALRMPARARFTPRCTASGGMRPAVAGAQ